MIDLKHTILDKDGSMAKEDFLKLKNHEKPEIKSQEEILTIFNNVILYIDYPHLKKEEYDL